MVDRPVCVGMTKLRKAAILAAAQNLRCALLVCMASSRRSRRAAGLLCYCWGGGCQSLLLA